MPDDDSPRTLVLLRHGKAEHAAAHDHRRRLTERGVHDARHAGEWVAGLGLAGPLVAYVSSAARAEGTWEQVAPALADLDPEVEVRDDLYLAAADDVRVVVAGTDAVVATVVVVAHNPTMTDLALELSDGTEGPEQERLQRQGLPTSGCAVLELASWDAAGGRLVRFATPRDQ